MESTYEKRQITEECIFNCINCVDSYVDKTTIKPSQYK